MLRVWTSLVGCVSQVLCRVVLRRVVVGVGGSVVVCGGSASFFVCGLCACLFLGAAVGATPWLVF